MVLNRITATIVSVLLLNLFVNYLRRLLCFDVLLLIHVRHQEALTATVRVHLLLLVSGAHWLGLIPLVKQWWALPATSRNFFLLVFLLFFNHPNHLIRFDCINVFHGHFVKRLTTVVLLLSALGSFRRSNKCFVATVVHVGIGLEGVGTDGWLLKKHF